MNKRWILLMGLVVVLAALALMLGTPVLSLSEIVRICFGGEVGGDASFVVLEYRLPRMLTALLAGAGLAVSGLLMQTMFRNPLAGPYVLGISSGSSFAVALWMMGMGWFSGLGLTGLGRDGIQFVVSFMGAMGVLGVMLIASSRLGGTFTILILGLITGQVLGALQGALTFFASPQSLKQFSLWGLGSFNQTDYSGIIWLLVVCVGVMVWVFPLSSRLNHYLLGDAFAASMGVKVGTLRTSIIWICGLTVAVVTSTCGPVAFIGMAVPHLVRYLFLTFDHRILIPACGLMGGGLALFCDILAHVPLWPSVLPVNVLSAIIGGPVVIYVVFRQRKNSFYE
jgi:iron complex transport system permease protein